MRVPFRDIIRFADGFYYSLPELAEQGDYLTSNSYNIIYHATGQWKPIGGPSLDAGKIGSPLMFNVSGGYVGLGNKASASTAKGTIASFIGDSLLIVGSGEVYRNGARFQAGTGPTNVDASTTPRIVLKQSGSYTGSTTNGPFEMGLDVPSAPTVTTIASGNTSKMASTSSPAKYSIQVAAGRFLTGHESNATAVSTPVSVTNLQALAVTFATAGSNGEDRWHVYGSAQGEGGIGAHLKVREVKESSLSGSSTPTVSHTNGSPTVTLTAGTVSKDDLGKRIRIANFDGLGGTFTSWIRDVPVAPGSTTATTLTMADNITATGSGKTATIDAQVGGVARTLAIEYYDSDRKAEIPPTDHNKPPKCVFLAVLGERVLYIGCYADGTSDPTAANPGVMVQASKQNYPEAAPADFNHLYALPGQPTAVFTREAEGIVYVFGSDFLVAFSFGGVSDSGERVLQMTVLWQNLGIANQNAACVADGELYAYTGAQGIVRLGADGRPDHEFGRPLGSALSGNGPSGVITGYDPADQQVFYGDTQSLNIYPYGRRAGQWGPTVSTSNITTWPGGGQVKAYFASSGQCYAVFDAGGVDYAVYKFNFTAGVTTWNACSGYRDGGRPGMVKTVTRVRPATSQLMALENKSLSVTLTRNMAFFPATGDQVTHTFASPGQNSGHPSPWKCNFKNARSYQVQASFTPTLGGYGGLNYIVVEGVASPISV